MTREGTVERLTVDGARRAFVAATVQLGIMEHDHTGHSEQEIELAEAAVESRFDRLRTAILDEQREAVDGLVKASRQIVADAGWWAGDDVHWHCEMCGEYAEGQFKAEGHADACPVAPILRALEAVRATRESTTRGEE